MGFLPLPDPLQGYDTARDGGGTTIPLARGPDDAYQAALSNSPDPGFLSRLWSGLKTTLAPLASGMAVPAAGGGYLAGQAMPEAYQRAYRQMIPDPTKQAYDPDPLEYHLLPTAGEVLVEHLIPGPQEGFARLGKTAASLAGAMLTDPVNLFTGGIAGARKAGRILSAGQKALATGRTALPRTGQKALQLSPRALANLKAKQVGDVLGSAAAGGVYAPMLAEGTVGGIEEAWQRMKAGEEGAWVPAAEAALMGGMGALMGRGAVQDVKALRGVKGARPRGEITRPGRRRPKYATVVEGLPPDYARLVRERLEKLQVPEEPKRAELEPSPELAAALREAEEAPAEAPTVDLARPKKRPTPEREIPWNLTEERETRTIEVDPFRVFEQAEEDILRPGRARQEVEPGLDKLTRATDFLKYSTRPVDIPELQIGREGKLEIGDGFHRMMAAAELGHDRVPVRVRAEDLGAIRDMGVEGAEPSARPGRPEGAEAVQRAGAPDEGVVPLARGRVQEGAGRAAAPEAGGGRAVYSVAGQEVEAKAKPTPSKQPFYSHLRRIVDKIKQPKATASDFLRYLKDPKRGVKAEELKWTGLDQFLKEKKGKVTRQEMQDFLAENDVEIHEVVKGDLEPGRTGWDEYDSSRLAPEDREWFDQMADNENLTHAERMRWDTLAGQARTHEMKPLLEAPKFGEWQLPGGKEGSYREVLLMLGRKKVRQPELEAAEKELRELETRSRVLAREKPEGWEPESRRISARAAKLRRRIIAEDKAREAKPFTGGHWPESDVLAHVRFNERTGPNGERVLFVEEAQSDWHQAGKRRGYRQPGAWHVFERPSGDWSLHNDRGELEGYFGSRKEAERVARTSGADDVLLRKEGGDLLPPAPFAGATKSPWHEMAMRRMVRWAAEEGYDRISWINGEETAKRYDLSRQIETVAYKSAGKGFTELEIIDKQSGSVAGELQGRVPRSTRTDEGTLIVPNDGLAGLVGKDLAEKILAGQGKAVKEAEGWKTFQGIDLAIGGEWAKNLYDVMIPSAMRKFGKQWGAEVGETRIATPEEARVEVVTEPGAVVPSFAEKRQEATTRPFQSMEITPTMRESVVGGGVPKFEVEGKPEPKPEPAPKEKVTRETVVKAFGGWRGVVEGAKDGKRIWRVSLPGRRRILVREDGEIRVDKAALEEGYEGKTAEEVAAGKRTVVGAFEAGVQAINPTALIRLAKHKADQGVLDHEAFHAAMEMALSPQQREAILKEHGAGFDLGTEGGRAKAEEAAARAYAAWDGTKGQGAFEAIRAFFKRVLGQLDQDAIFESVRSGEAWKQKPPAQPATMRAPKYHVAGSATARAAKDRALELVGKLVSPERIRINQSYHRTSMGLDPYPTKRRHDPIAPESKVYRGKKDGKPFIVGKVSFGDWLKRAQAWLPEKAAWKAARGWYREMMGAFTQEFGAKDAPQRLLMWAQSQQNSSPSLGLLNVLRAVDIAKGVSLRFPEGHPRAGEPIRAGLAEEKMVSTFKETAATSGIGAKLADFIDSVFGRTTRTWVGGDPDGGRPVAIDVHAGRDIGYIDKETVNHARKAGMPWADALKLDGDPAKPELAKGPNDSQPRYEYGHKFYHDLAAWLNKKGVDGGGWQPHEVQAVGWTTVRRMFGIAEEGPREIFEKNIRNVSAEVADFGDGAPLAKLFKGAAPEQMRKVHERVGPILFKEAAKRTGVVLHEVTSGIGGYGKWTNPDWQVRVMGSPEQIQDFARFVGLGAQQTQVVVSRALESGKNRAVEFRVAGKVAPEQFEAAWIDAVAKDPTLENAGYSIIFDEGIPKMRIFSGEDADGKKLIPTWEFNKRFAEGGESQKILAESLAENAKNDDIRVSLGNVETVWVSNKWTEAPDGADYSRALQVRRRELGGFRQGIRSAYEEAHRRFVRGKVPRAAPAAEAAAPRVGEVPTPGEPRGPPEAGGARPKLAVAEPEAQKRKTQLRTEIDGIGRQISALKPGTPEAKAEFQALVARRKSLAREIESIDSELFTEPGPAAQPLKARISRWDGKTPTEVSFFYRGKAGSEPFLISATLKDGEIADPDSRVADYVEAKGGSMDEAAAAVAAVTRQGPGEEAAFGGGKVKAAVAEPEPEAPPPPPLGRPMEPEEAPRVETHVKQLRAAEEAAGKPPAHLSREDKQHWLDMDEDVREHLRTKDDNWYAKTTQRRTLDSAESQALQARTRGAYEAAQGHLSKMRHLDRMGDAEGATKAKTEYMAETLRQVALQRAFINDGTSAGRALAARARVMDPSFKGGDEALIHQIHREIPGITDRQLAKLVDAIKNDPESAPDLIRNAYGYSAMDKVLEWWKAGLLSAFSTDGANFSGNVLEQITKFTETGASALVDSVLGVVPAGYRGEGGRQRFYGEMGMELAGTSEAFGPALGKLANGFLDLIALNEKKIKQGEKFAFQTGAIGGTLGKIIRTSFHKLGVMDDFFKAVGTRAELGKLSFRKASMELGPSADKRQVLARAQQIIDEIRSPVGPGHPELVSKAADSALHRTFQEMPSPLAKAILNVLRDPRYKLGQFVIPFVKTPANILKRTVERSPLGFKGAMKLYGQWKRGEAGVTRGDVADAFARPLIGTAIMAGAYELAEQGGMTGGGPTDYREQALKKETGWQPNSFVYLDSTGTKHYIPFSRFEPFGTTLGLVADAWEMRNTTQEGDLIDKALASVAEGIFDKTYLRGASDAANLISKPSMFAPAYISNVVGSIIPNIVARAAKAYDPVMRETKGADTGIEGLLPRIGRTIKSRIPFASTELAAKVTPTGEPRVRPGGPLGRFAGPVQFSAEKAGKEVERFLLSIGWVPPVPKQDTTFHSVKIRLTDHEHKYLQQGLTAAARQLRQLVKNPGFQKMHPAEQERMARKIYAQHQSYAKKIVTSQPEFLKRYHTAWREQREAQVAGG